MISGKRFSKVSWLGLVRLRFCIALANAPAVTARVNAHEINSAPTLAVTLVSFFGLRFVCWPASRRAVSTNGAICLATICHSSFGRFFAFKGLAEATGPPILPRMFWMSAS